MEEANFRSSCRLPFTVRRENGVGVERPHLPVDLFTSSQFTRHQQLTVCHKRLQLEARAFPVPRSPYVACRDYKPLNCLTAFKISNALKKKGKKAIICPTNQFRRLKNSWDVYLSALSLRTLPVHSLHMEHATVRQKANG